MNKEKILGFNVCSDNYDCLINNILQDYKNNKQVIIASINPQIIVKNYNNQSYINKINAEKYQIPDGIGIVYYSKLNNGNIKERISGIDLMHKICSSTIPYNSRIFLYGSKKGVAEKAMYELQKTYPGINIVGTCDGFLNEKDVLKKIINVNPDILFIGLGSPKQEEFIFKYKNDLKNIKILMPVGRKF